MRPAISCYLVASIFLSALATGRCDAGSSDDSVLHFETYVGADYDGRAASLTSSTVWSPFDPITQTGFRIKLDGLASLYGDTNATVLSGNFLAADIKGLGDIMAGYQFNRGPLWLKIYAGLSYQTQMRLFWEAGRTVQQTDWGGAAAIEAYYRFNDRLWASANLSWLQPDNATSFYVRAAYEIYRGESGVIVSAGAETAFAISNADTFKEGEALNIYNNYSRAGGLLNVRYGRNDFSVSGGLSQASDETAWRPYATIRYGRQF